MAKNNRETPCDWMKDDDGFAICPYEDFGGYESERCRVCCGLGVDEDYDYDYDDDDYTEE